MNVDKVTFLINENDVNFEFINKLQLNLDKPNDFAFEFAEEAVKQEMWERLRMDLIRYRGDGDIAQPTFKPTTKEKQDFIKNRLILIKAESFRNVGGGFFEVSGCLIK